MNQIFRVIWNHATQSWVAVSELTSAKGKTKSKTMSKLAALSLVAGTALSMDAMAASSTITAVSKTDGNLAILTNNQNSFTAQSTDPATPKNVIYIGNGRVPSAIGDEFVAIGNDMTGNSGGRAGDTLIGNRVRSGGGGQDSFATAVGYGAQVSGPSVSIGVGTSSDIGDATGWKAVKNSGISIGAFSRVSGTADGGVAMGAISFADQTGSVAIGQLSGAASLLYDREVAGNGAGGKLYKTAEATGGNLVSIGAEAGARSRSSVAIGTQATTSKGNDSIAMGTNSAAIKDNSIAIGHAAIAGGHTQADIDALDAKKMLLEADKVNADKRLEEKTAAAEANPTAENKFQVSAAKAAVERLGLAIRRIDADLQRLSSVTTRNATNAIAIGNQSQATDESALAFGNTARAKGVASIAQGKNTQATAENAIAVGTSSNVSGENSVALGANITKLTTANSVVLGANSTEVVGTTGASHAVQTVNDATVRTVAGPNFTYSGFVGKPADAGHYVSIGQAGKERQIKNLAAGAVTPTSTDAINGSQLYALMDRVENKQEPVVYTNAAGDKLVKVGNDFYKTEDLDPATGKPLAGKNPVPAGDVIASMNNADNNTTTPMALANIAGNLPGAKNGSEAPTTSGKLPEGADAPKTSNAATVGDVLNAGWNLTEKGEARDFVKPYDTVDFIDGKGTSVNVTTDTDGKVSHIKYDVKAADDSITVGDDGIKVNTGGITPVTKDNGDKKSGQVIPNKGDENKVASVGDVANAINSAFWKVTGAEDGGKFADGNTTTEEQVKAGDKVTFKAGKNIKLKQDGKNFTYSLNPELTDITSIGGKGTTMTFKPEGVDLGDKNITGVKSALNTTPVTTTPDGSPTPEADKPNLVDLVGTKDAPVNKNAAATVGDLQNMGWVVSSDKTTDALDKAYKDTVKNANEVKFVGTGAATVSGKTVDGIRTITVDVKQPETATLTSTGGTVTNPEGDNANKLVTAGNVAEMINKSGFNLKTSADTGEKVSGTKDNGELINPGATVEMVAGKNMSVKQDADGKVTYATKDDVEFNTVTVGKPAEVYTNKDGKPLTKTKDGKYTDPDGNEVPEKDVVTSNVSPVKLATEKAIPADNNQDGKAPTTALNVTSTDGKPTQITGVGSVLSNESIPTNTNGTPTAQDKQPKLVNLGTKPDENGKVTPLPDNVLNSAATVRDLANMGWVVGAPENGYVDTVKNANKVDFKGENGISVTGKTNDKGVREITIAVKDGEVVKPNEFTAKVNGKDTPVTKVGDQYYNTADIDPKTGKPNSKANPVTPDADTTPTNSGDGYVTGNKVATAIQKSGFVVGKQTEKLSAADFKDEDEKVNPDDELRFADGNNTKVKLATKESVDKDGNKVTTTTVKVDVTGLPVQYTDKNGTPVTKVGDKYFTVDDKGNPTTTEVAPADLTTNMVNPAAKPNEIGAPTTLGNVKSNLPSVNDADKNAKDVDGNPIAGKDNKSAPIDAAKAADIAKNVGNNAATVSDVLNAGWNLQNNGKAKDFVKPYDTVNFVDGKGTKAVVKTEEDGTTSNVKFDIDTGSITNNADGSVQGPVVTPEMTKALEDATNTLNNLPATAPAAVRKAAEQAVADAANNIANVANKVATAQDVANAINKSGFTLTTSANGGEKISGTPEMINPGKKVEMVAGKNMTVKQEFNGKVTYATASNVTFDSVQFGDNGPKITNNGGNINVGTATGAPTKITGVAPGEISATSKDAVNGSQLYAMGNKLQGQINKLGKRMNAGMATSAAMANLLQPHKSGQSVVTAGVGQHKNQSAVAVGYSRLSDNGKYGVRFSMGANTQGEVTGGAAVGYFW
ncbi:ESPR-type extended signal peptide-containing protein [Haemophilus haemolyticus]|uniref:ESPR-type extended signal peptide-containing protein n=1 Tax=Haemophilus haemolyticus TaxID=726 RepID=UPI00195975EB|nr:ESPR-type extended signal peptide-containing protein [Haemophilus haemolyticus]VTX82951.1 Autotransporter adhesin NhhA [Haemophilus haemolyticus]